VVALIYIILANYVTLRVYNYWVVLGLELFFMGIWSNGFLSTNSSTRFKMGTGCVYVWSASLQDFVEDCTDHTADAAYMAAARARYAVIGLVGSLLILWVVSFIVTCVSIARHRKVGGHCKTIQ